MSSLYARWQRGELTPEEIAEQNDFFRAWMEKCSSRPPVGVDVRARMPVGRVLERVRIVRR
jgi:hypothetical protein